MAAGLQDFLGSDIRLFLISLESLLQHLNIMQLVRQHPVVPGLLLQLFQKLRPHPVLGQL